MKEKMIVGVDVSKATLDFHCKPGDVFFSTTNNAAGFKRWWKQVRQLKYTSATLFVVMEHTGRYSCRFETFLRTQEVSYCKLPALEIKRSLGLVRGKNDKADAERIAEYGWLRKDILQPQQDPSPHVQELRELLSLRTKMVRDRSSYISRLKEIEVSDHDITGELKVVQKRIIAFLTVQISKLETRIRETINNDSLLRSSCDLLISIKGIGLIVAAHMISCTDNFRRFGTARKFNCYAGLAPFKHESGTSIRSRSRVSHLANKGIKSLLNLAACSAIQCDDELKNYYKRRVEEGKRKMSCLNIVRAKLVARMFAVIKRQTPYELVRATA